MWAERQTRLGLKGRQDRDQKTDKVEGKTDKKGRKTNMTRAKDKQDLSQKDKQYLSQKTNKIGPKIQTRSRPKDTQIGTKRRKKEERQYETEN